MTTIEPASRSPEGLDVEFYTTYYSDLASLKDDEAIAHYVRRGRREGRYPNSAALIAALENQCGPLGEDFDPDRQREQPRFNQRPHFDWQVAAHHLQTRGSASVQEKTVRDRGPPPAGVVRSWVEERRINLQKVFGSKSVDQALLATIVSAAALVASNPTPAARLLDDVVLARFFLSAFNGKAMALSSLSAQLRVLFFVLFQCPAVARSSAELLVANRLIRTVVASEIVPETSGRLGVTLLMLAARATLGLELDRAESEADQYLADFFGRHVLELSLQPFVTAKQRERLRAPSPSSHPSGLPLAARYRFMAGPEGFPAPPLEADASTPYSAWFWDEGVWRFKLDYILSSEQLDALTVRVDSQRSDMWLLSAPMFLSSAVSPSDGHLWLQRLIDCRRARQDISPLLIHSTAASYVRGAWVSSIETAKDDQPQGFALQEKVALRLQPGELVVFGADSNGAFHCIGDNWLARGCEHQWGSEKAALLAVRLSAEDGGPLDLFLDMGISNGYGGAWISVYWNGQPIGEHRPHSGRWFHGHLGGCQRTGRNANILSLALHCDRAAAQPPARRRPQGHLWRLILATR